MRNNFDDRSDFYVWSSAKRPKIFEHEKRDEAILDLPDYKTRCEAMASDPWAVVLSFCNSVTFLLPRALGMQMCPICPRCNAGVCLCSNAFGHNMLPTGANYLVALLAVVPVLNVLPLVTLLSVLALIP